MLVRMSNLKSSHGILTGMSNAQTTCWTLIHAAAAGDSGGREAFALRYDPIIRAYLAARWEGSPLQNDLADASQEVFVECFRHSGPLDRVERERPGGFRPFLYGIVRNVALRFERRRAIDHARHPAGEMDLEQLQADETSLSQVFNRAWAREIMQQAAQRQIEQAGQSGPEAMRRVELLRLRFHEGLPIREIARNWNVDPSALHHEYAKARKEFKAILREVIAFHQPFSPSDVEREYSELLRSLA